MKWSDVMRRQQLELRTTEHVLGFFSRTGLDEVIHRLSIHRRRQLKGRGKARAAVRIDVAVGGVQPEGLKQGRIDAGRHADDLREGAYGDPTQIRFC